MHSYGIATWALGIAMATGACMDESIVDDPTADSVAETQQALTCRNAGCDGWLPSMSDCPFDPQLSIVADGRVIDFNGVQIGGIGLYYSPMCHTVWGATAFYQDQNHRTCAVRRAAVNEPICQDYTQSRGNVSPMRFLAIGQTGFGRTVLPNGVTARTGDFTRF